MLDQGNIFYLENARIIRNTIKELSVFLNCNIDNDNAILFIETLIKNKMLYYFEEEAELVANEKGECIFSSNQAAILNIIRDRFKENSIIYKKLFNEVENNFSYYCAV